MGILNIYAMDSLKEREVLREQIQHVNSCSLKNGYIHIQYDDSLGSLAGVHFPVPYDFTRIEFLKG